MYILLICLLNIDSYVGVFLLIWKLILVFYRVYTEGVISTSTAFLRLQEFKILYIFTYIHKSPLIYTACFIHFLSSGIDPSFGWCPSYCVVMLQVFEYISIGWSYLKPPLCVNAGYGSLFNHLLILHMCAGNEVIYIGMLL